MIWDRKPTRLPRAIRICRIGLAPAISAPMAISPEGPAASENAAISTAIAAGNRRPVAMARSMEHHVSRAPRAMMGSGRRPTYLDNDWDRDWGSLEQYTPLDSDAVPAQMNVTTETRDRKSTRLNSSH